MLCTVNDTLPTSVNTNTHTRLCVGARMAVVSLFRPVTSLAYMFLEFFEVVLLSSLALNVLYGLGFKLFED